jgi:hypothetical protein
MFLKRHEELQGLAGAALVAGFGLYEEGQDAGMVEGCGAGESGLNGGGRGGL